MAEQFLKRPQVRSARQQMRREAVPQARAASACPASPSRRRAAATERRTRSGLSGPPRAPTNNGASPRQRIGALPHIILDRLAHRRHDRHDPGLRPLAGDPQASRRSAGSRAVSDSASATRKPGAVEQQQDRKVARADPRRARRLGGILGKLHRFVGRGRPRQRSRPLRRARARQLRRDALLLGRIVEEGANAGELARRRRRRRARSRAGRRGRRAGRRRRRRVSAAASICSPRYRPRNSISRCAVAT